MRNPWFHNFWHWNFYSFHSLVCTDIYTSINTTSVDIYRVSTRCRVSDSRPGTAEDPHRATTGAGAEVLSSQVILLLTTALGFRFIKLGDDAVSVGDQTMVSMVCKSSVKVWPVTSLCTPVKLRSHSTVQVSTVQYSTVQYSTGHR